MYVMIYIVLLDTVVCLCRRCSVARRRSVQWKVFTLTLATLLVWKHSTRQVTVPTANRSVYRPLKVCCILLMAY